MARGRHLAVVDLADRGDELVDMRHVRLVPVPFEHPGADARLGRQAFEDFELLLGAGDVKALVEAELHRLLQRVDRVVAGLQKDDDVGIRRLRLDQVGRIVGGAERRQRSADLGAAELLEAGLEALLQGVPESIVGGDESTISCRIC